MSTTSRSEPGARARGRRFRTLGALLATSLAAPLAFVAVATTAGPAGAAPADGTPLVVTGDVVGRNLSAPASPNWTWESADYDELRDIFDDYGPGGATYTLGTPVASPTYTDPNPAVIGDETGSLANVDVYVSSAVGGGGTVDTSHYTLAEEQALLRWVRAGGVLIANTNSRAFDVTRYLGDDPDQGDYVAVHEPRLFFDGTHGCLDQPGTPDCAGGQDESAPVASAVVAGTALSAGVTSIRNWHTITYFEPGTLPANAVTVATINYDCVDTAPTCADQGATPDYDNDTNGPQTILAYMPFGSPQFGKGSVVFTSDVDTFSNHYNAQGGAGTEMAPGNRTLAENMVDWIADNRTTPLATNGFTPITPTRVYDTRPGNSAGTAVGKVAGGAVVNVQVGGKSINGGGTIPLDATAVAINVTATNQSAAGFLTVTPGGAAKSNTSNLNIPAGLIDVANVAAVGLGDGGKIRVYNENNPTDIIVDVVGYWSPSGAGFLTAIDPANGRVFDTRNNVGTTGGKLGPGATRSVQITGQGGVPGGATAVVMNVTATNGTTGGFLTIHDSATAPDASNVNFRVNTNVPNLVFAKLDGTGKVNVTNALGQTDVIFDVAGYFTTTGSEIHPVGPGRIFDTRAPIGQLFAGKVAANGIAEVGINGAAGVLPTDGVGAILANVTVDQPAAGGFLTAYPKSLTTPNSSNVNFAPGQTVANLALVKVSDEGKVQVKNDSLGGSNVIIDVFAWFS